MGANNRPICQCVECNALGVHKYSVRRRGGNNAFLCDFHKQSLESYFTENITRIGEMKKNGYTYSVELECSAASFRARLELCLASFLPTADSTVFAEFKSPIYNGACALKAFLPSIQDLIDAGDFRIGSECGTHFHVGQKDYINRRYMDYIRRFYHSLFVPLNDALKADDAKATAIFGRPFCYWASEIYNGIDPQKHENWVNTQHENTLEYRRAFFRDAAQYARCADFCREVTEKVVNTFCKRVEALGLQEGQRLTEEQEEELTKAAKKAGRQIVKVFQSFEI